MRDRYDEGGWYEEYRRGSSRETARGLPAERAEEVRAVREEAGDWGERSLGEGEGRVEGGREKGEARGRRRRAAMDDFMPYAIGG